MASTNPFLSFLHHLQSPSSGAMSSLVARVRATRYILLTLLILFSFWYWRQSFQVQPPSSQVPSAFIPAKLYEPDAVACTDNLADQPELVSL